MNEYIYVRFVVVSVEPEGFCDTETVEKQLDFQQCRVIESNETKALEIAHKMVPPVPAGAEIQFERLIRV